MARYATRKTNLNQKGNIKPFNARAKFKPLWYTTKVEQSVTPPTPPDEPENP